MGRWPTSRTGEAIGVGESESGEMPKEVLEIGGKRCKFGAIENEQPS